MTGADSALPAAGLSITEATAEHAWAAPGDRLRRAWYLKVFDDAGDRLSELAGMGAAYTRRTHNSWVALESHLSVMVELRPGDHVRVESRVLAVDERKLHVSQAMYAGDVLVATHEQLGLHFDTLARRASPFEPAVRARFEALAAAQTAAPPPRRVGATVTMS
ncbi:MAG: thioesterase family protein [Gammaproteobacteria bacterium]